MDLVPGQRVGNYVVEAPIGGGGMATVWKVRHAGLGTVHALKVLSPELLVHEDVRRRFLDEGRIQATLQHPNIVAVTDLVAEPGIAGLVMEYVEGPTLEDVLKAGPMAPARAIDVMRQVLDAVGAAHARGVVHRDLKPSNLIETKRGVVKVLDFGIAKLMGDAKRATKTGTRLGTLLYMSPEQVRGSKETDARADIWALGVILYELVTGQAPFDAADDLDIMNAIAAGRFTPASERNRQVPRALDGVIAKALTVPANGRFTSCEAFEAALVAAPQTPAVLPPLAAPLPPPQAPQAPPPPKRSSGRTVVIVLGAVLTSATLLVAGAKLGSVFQSTLAPTTPAQWPVTKAPAAPAPKPAAVAAPVCPDGMVLIKGGTFDMGSNDGDPDERPVHRVTVSSFCLDRYERHDGNKIPLVNVTWYEARRDCEADGNRLPTEAEWEFAARGVEGRKYPWGNREPTCDMAQFDACDGELKAVGWRPSGATREGVHDLAGNMWEWTADCYRSYPPDAQVNPSDGQGPCRRVVRGGGVGAGSAQLRTSDRSSNKPEDRFFLVGFRCARDLRSD